MKPISDRKLSKLEAELVYFAQEGDPSDLSWTLKDVESLLKEVRKSRALIKTYEHTILRRK